MKPLVSLIPKGTSIELNIFADYIYPNGYLSNRIEEHALFFYYIHASETYKKYIIEEPIIYEGDVDPRTDFEQLFKSVASLYGVHPQNMANCWPVIDRQVARMGLLKIPNENKYRFNSIIVLGH